MRKQIVDLLKNQELNNFIRIEPIWYRKLSRNPLEIKAFQYAANHSYKKTFPQKVEKAVNSIEIAAMMLQLLQNTKNND